MENRYSHTQFQISDKWTVINSNSREYTCLSDEFPDIILTAKVEKTENGYEVSENYGFLILPRYLEKYGLSGSAAYNSQGFYWAFYYPDPREKDPREYVHQFQDFIDSEEMKRLPSDIAVSFCPETALFPKIIVQGGAGGLPEPLLYELGTIPDMDDLLMAITDSYIAYMINYESWNLTDDLYSQFEDRYLLLDSQHPLSSVVVATPGDRYNHIFYIRRQSGFPLQIYSEIKTNSVQIGENTYYQPYEAGYITVGNAFLYLKLSGADVRVNADGSGFTVRKDGQVHLFGQGCDSQELPLNDIYNLTEQNYTFNLDIPIEKLYELME